MTQPIAILPTTPHRNADTASRVVEAESSEKTQFGASDEGMSFDDVLNAVNPLHHIPIVSTIYQAVSGAKIGIGPRMIAAAILGGPAGLILAGISAFIEEMSGGTMAEHAVALFDGVTGDGGPAPANMSAAVPNHTDGGTESIDASALGDVPAIQPALIDEQPIGADWNGEKLAAIVPAVLGAMSPVISRQDVASFKSEGFQSQDSESRRISQSVLHAQRAQANLLLANLRTNGAVKSRLTVERDEGDSEERDPHSNLRPSGAGPLWYADAMQRALDKYRTGPATPVGAP
jgi:hypothetical protein